MRSCLAEQPRAVTDQTALLWKLRSGSDDERFAAVEAMHETLGPAAREPLCEALEDRNTRVRIAAALALGELRDGRAVEPLLGALRGAMSGGTASRHFRTGLLISAAWLGAWMVVFAALLCHSWTRGTAACTSIMLLQGLLAYLHTRREANRFAAAISQALAEIAEHQVTPEVYGLSGELQLLAKDRVQHDRVTRRLLLDAVERIEEATAGYRDLPLASASGSGEEVSQLPRTAAAPSHAANTLPRV